MMSRAANILVEMPYNGDARRLRDRLKGRVLMRCAAIFWWMIVICHFTTLFVSAILNGRLFAEQQDLSVVGMLIWIVLSSLVSSLTVARSVPKSAWHVFVIFASIECVSALCLSAEAWHIPASYRFDRSIVFPVWAAISSSVCSQLSIRPGRENETARWIPLTLFLVSLVSFGIAVYSLLHSLVYASSGTKLFLQFFVIVSGLSLQWTLHWCLQILRKSARPQIVP